MGKTGGEGDKQELKLKGQQWLLRERERQVLGSKLGRVGYSSDGESRGDRCSLDPAAQGVSAWAQGPHTSLLCFLAGLAISLALPH